MYRNRLEYYRQIEELRQTKLLVYVTGDRQGLETQIHNEIVDYFTQHLDVIGTVPKISLYLYSRGGQTIAAWSIVNLLCQFAEHFEVIVPSKALSAGTLICLGANTIVMTKQATLGPIDPSVNTPLNPAIPGAPIMARVPVSVEAINGFIELAKDTGINNSADLSTIISILATHVHPLVLGDVFRTRSQIRMLGKRLLARHMDDGEKIEKILSFLCSESGSHDYTIYRQEARNELGLTVEHPGTNLYKIIKSIYDDISDELMLFEPYNPDILIAGKNDVKYTFRRALVESILGGSHCFMSEGQLVKRKQADKQTGIEKQTIEDNRMFEGWKHEKL